MASNSSSATGVPRVFTVPLRRGEIRFAKISAIFNLCLLIFIFFGVFISATKNHHQSHHHHDSRHSSYFFGRYVLALPSNSTTGGLIPANHVSPAIVKVLIIFAASGFFLFLTLALLWLLVRCMHARKTELSQHGSILPSSDLDVSIAAAVPSSSKSDSCQRQWVQEEPQEPRESAPPRTEGTPRRDGERNRPYIRDLEAAGKGKQVEEDPVDRENRIRRRYGLPLVSREVVEAAKRPRHNLMLPPRVGPGSEWYRRRRNDYRYKDVNPFINQGGSGGTNEQIRDPVPQTSDPVNRMHQLAVACPDSDLDQAGAPDPILQGAVGPIDEGQASIGGSNHSGEFDSISFDEALIRARDLIHNLALEQLTITELDQSGDPDPLLHGTMGTEPISDQVPVVPTSNHNHGSDQSSSDESPEHPLNRRRLSRPIEDPIPYTSRSTDPDRQVPVSNPGTVLPGGVDPTGSELILAGEDQVGSCSDQDVGNCTKDPTCDPDFPVGDLVHKQLDINMEQILHSDPLEKMNTAAMSDPVAQVLIGNEEDCGSTSFHTVAKGSVSLRAYPCSSSCGVQGPHPDQRGSDEEPVLASVDAVSAPPATMADEDKEDDTMNGHDWMIPPMQPR